MFFSLSSLRCKQDCEKLWLIVESPSIAYCGFKRSWAVIEIDALFSGYCPSCWEGQVGWAVCSCTNKRKCKSSQEEEGRGRHWAARHCTPVTLRKGQTGRGGNSILKLPEPDVLQCQSSGPVSERREPVWHHQATHCHPEGAEEDRSRLKGHNEQVKKEDIGGGRFFHGIYFYGSLFKAHPQSVESMWIDLQWQSGGSREPVRLRQLF